MARTIKNSFMLGAHVSSVSSLRRKKFGEHKRAVRTAQGANKSKSSFLSALKTACVHLINK